MAKGIQVGSVASILYKWFALGIIAMCMLSFTRHPIFVSVTEINHNAQERSLELSCRIFTDDLEQAIRVAYKTKADILHPADKTAMNNMISDYIRKHLVVSVDGKPVALKFVGYEQDEEAIMTYFETPGISGVKSLQVTDNILFESRPQQMNIIHATVKGTRKSTKLDNPDATASFSF